MKNKNKYIEIFTDSLSIEKNKFNEKLKYNDIPEWDSIGHMTLMSALEEGFNISIDTDDIIDYVEFRSKGNAADFGNLTGARHKFGACSTSTRGVWGGGYSNKNVIEYVTIATTGNGTDFGDLLHNAEWPSGTQGDA